MGDRVGAVVDDEIVGSVVIIRIDPSLDVGQGAAMGSQVSRPVREAADPDCVVRPDAAVEHHEPRRTAGQNVDLVAVSEGIHVRTRIVARCAINVENVAVDGPPGTSLPPLPLLTTIVNDSAVGGAM